MNLHELEKLRSLVTVSVLGAIFAFGCSTPSVEGPKGSSKGYSSARLVRTDAPVSSSDDLEDSPLVNAQVQAAIRSNFQQNGIVFGGDSADLTVAYLIIHQNPASTAMNSDYFGNGRDAWKIIDEAHKRGVIENKRPDSFEAGAVVIDILDSKTDELIFRNYAKRDIIAAASAEERQRRINGAVSEALSSFFK